MGIFQQHNMNEAGKPNGGGLRFLKGEYECEIVACKEHKARYRGDAFIVEFKILERVGETGNEPGVRVGWYVACYGKAADMAPINIRQFLTAAVGLNSYDDKHTAKIAEISSSKDSDWNKLGEMAVKEGTFDGFRVHVQVVPVTNEGNKDKPESERFHKIMCTPSNKPTEFQLELIKGLS